jgi:hypothetical protein
MTRSMARRGARNGARPPPPLGCGACVRIRNLDGSVAEGLQVEAGDAETGR